MTKKPLIGIILVGFLTAGALAFYAGDMYGRKNMMDEYGAISGLLEGRSAASHMAYALAALRRGDQKKAEELLVTKLILSTTIIASILDSAIDHDPFFSEQCEAILKTDDIVNAEKVLDGLVEKDVALYKQNMRRIRDACSRLRAST